MAAVGGGWRLVAIGGWRLAGGGGWWRLAAVGGWRLAVGGWWLVAVGSGWRLAVGGGWRLAIGGGWWLAVGGPWGRSLRAVLSKKKFFGSLRTPVDHGHGHKEPKEGVALREICARIALRRSRPRARAGRSPARGGALTTHHQHNTRQHNDGWHCLTSGERAHQDWPHQPWWSRSPLF